MPVPIIYSDVNQDYNQEYSPSTLIGIDPIYQSLFNLLTTIPGERLNLPEYGVNLDRYRFRLFDEDLAYVIFNEIIRAVDRWEPRVIVDRTESKYWADESSHEYHVKLVFRLRNYGDELYYLEKVVSTQSTYRINKKLKKVYD